jgi:hypothetical protein
MGKQHDRLIAVVDDAVSEAGLVSEDELDAIFAGNIGCGDDSEFIPIDEAIEFDGTNEAAGNCAANGCAEAEIFALNVIDITSAAEQLVDAFLAKDGSADHAIFGAIFQTNQPSWDDSAAICSRRQTAEKQDFKGESVGKRGLAFAAHAEASNSFG